MISAPANASGLDCRSGGGQARARLRRSPPAGDRPLSEIKHDGYRVQAHLQGGHPRLFTRRSRLDERVRSAHQRLERHADHIVILDGEVVVHDKTGIADFDALQADLASERSDRRLRCERRRSSSASACRQRCSRRRSAIAFT